MLLMYDYNNLGNEFRPAVVFISGSNYNFIGISNTGSLISASTTYSFNSFSGPNKGYFKDKRFYYGNFGRSQSESEDRPYIAYLSDEIGFPTCFDYTVTVETPSAVSGSTHLESTSTAGAFSFMFGATVPGTEFLEASIFSSFVAWPVEYWVMSDTSVCNSMNPFELSVKNPAATLTYDWGDTAATFDVGDPMINGEVCSFASFNMETELGTGGVCPDVDFVTDFSNNIITVYEDTNTIYITGMVSCDGVVNVKYTILPYGYEMSL